MFFWIAYVCIGVGISLVVSKKVIEDNRIDEAFDYCMVGLIFFMAVILWPIVAFMGLFMYVGKILVRLVEGDGHL